MQHMSTKLLLSGSMLLGAVSAQAALPPEATLYKNPQCGCCDAYAGSSSLGVEFPPELGQDMTSTTTGGTT